MPRWVYSRCVGCRTVLLRWNQGGSAARAYRAPHVQTPVLTLDMLLDEFSGRVLSTCLSLTSHTSIDSSCFQANEMLLSGRKLTAQEACGKGLVSQVFWPGTFTQEVMVRIKELASCNPVVGGIHSLTHITFFFSSSFYSDFSPRELAHITVSSEAPTSASARPSAREMLPEWRLMPLCTMCLPYLPVAGA